MFSEINSSSESQASAASQLDDFKMLVCNGEIYEYLIYLMDAKRDFFKKKMDAKAKRERIKDLIIAQINADSQGGKFNFLLLRVYGERAHQLYANRDWESHKALFEKKNGMLWEAFSNEFPVITHIYETIKAPSHTNLSRILQRIESTGILEVVCRNISTAQPEIPIFSLHDCIVTTTEYKWEVQNYLLEGMNSFIGHYPHTKVEDWNPDYEVFINQPTIGQ